MLTWAWAWAGLGRFDLKSHRVPFSPAGVHGARWQVVDDGERRGGSWGSSDRWPRRGPPSGHGHVRCWLCRSSPHSNSGREYRRSARRRCLSDRSRGSKPRRGSLWTRGSGIRSPRRSGSISTSCYGRVIRMAWRRLQRRVSTPGSSRYRQYLTRDEFAARVRRDVE